MKVKTEVILEETSLGSWFLRVVTPNKSAKHGAFNDEAEARQHAKSRGLKITQVTHPKHYHYQGT